MKKKKGKFFLRILAFLFLIYLALLIANESGYYEAKIRDKVEITSSSIQEFEEKVKNGEEIDIEAFFTNDTIDYSSNMSKFGDNLTNTISDVAEKSMQFIGQILKSLF